MTPVQGPRRSNAGVPAGALSAVLWIAGTFAQQARSGSQPFPRPNDGMDVAQRFFRKSGAAVELNAGLQVLAAIALLAFAAAMSTFLREIGRDGRAAALVLSAGSVSAGALMIGGSVLSTLGDADVSTDAAQSRA